MVAQKRLFESVQNKTVCNVDNVSPHEDKSARLKNTCPREDEHDARIDECTETNKKIPFAFVLLLLCLS